MNRCKCCNKETLNKKFCSRSCAAKINNKGIKRHGKSPAQCKICGKKTDSHQRYYCSHKCHKIYLRTKLLEEWKITGKIGTFLLKSYLKEIYGNQCAECGITEWNNKPITLDVHHIDGNGENNIEENVCLLCPNCHRQTDTYGAKNKGNGRAIRRKRYLKGIFV